MADTGKPNENRGKSKAEGERWSSEQNSVRKAEQETPAENYPPDDGDNAGGITNRPLDEEVDNQESLPARGMSRDGEQPDGESEMDREEGRRER